jgi:glucan endo-1,3-alpha-glucosidase
MTSTEATIDIRDAITAGFDAFALNLPSTDSWATDAVSHLFAAASGTSFKLFFSFDMTRFSNPSQFLPVLEQYAANESYYLQNGRPFVSTYKGGTLTFGQSNANTGWTVAFRQPLVQRGIDPFFVPDFDDANGYPSGFFETFTVADGAFSWESAWPQNSQGRVNVSDSVDQSVLQEAMAARKMYMMRTLCLPLLDSLVLI